MNNLNTNELSRQEKLQSFMAAYVSCIPFLNYAIGQLLSFTPYAVHIAVIGFILLFQIPNFKNIKISAPCLVYLLIVFCYYYSTSHSSLNDFQFYFYFGVPILSSLFHKNSEKFLRYMTYFGILFIIFSTTIYGDLSRESANDTSVMGLSYSMLTILIAGALHFFYYRQHSNFLIKLCYITNFVFGIILLFHANRGVVLAIIIAAMLLYVKNFGKNKANRHITLRLIFVCIIMLIGALFYDVIIIKLHEITKSLDLEIDFIDKMFRLIKNSNVSNGRDFITQYTIENIAKSPLWGHGLSTILYNSRGTIVYPHNFILQLLYDGGLILFIPTFITIILSIRYILLDEDRDETASLLFFILVCIPKMFFSSDMWTNPTFWLYIISYLNLHRYIHDKEAKNDPKLL